MRKRNDSDDYPAKLDFGCYTYVIKFVEPDEIKEFMKVDDGSTFWGAIGEDIQTIYINKLATRQMQKLTLLHEITHAIVICNNLHTVADTDGTNNEGTIDRIAGSLLEIMNRNPELMHWLMS